MKFMRNYRDPVCDTCSNGKWEKGNTQICEALELTVRQNGKITENYAACFGASYKRKERA